MGRAGSTTLELDLDVSRTALDTIDIEPLIAQEVEDALSDFLYSRTSRVRYSPGNEQPYLDALVDLLVMEGMTSEHVEMREGGIAGWLSSNAMRSDPACGDEHGFDAYVRPYLLALGAASPISDYLIRHRSGTMHVLTSNPKFSNYSPPKTACGKRFDSANYEHGLERGSFTADGAKVCKNCAQNARQGSLMRRDVTERTGQLKVLNDYDSKRAKSLLTNWTRPRLVKLFESGKSREDIAKMVSKLFWTEIPAKAAAIGRRAAAEKILQMSDEDRRRILGLSPEDVRERGYPNAPELEKALAALDLSQPQEAIQRQLHERLSVSY